ncbi:hypothetical protein SLS62_000702 [Diatrype stigma]|uniref:Acyl-CoA dehydrogenase n=1 Tax=Diatrype stigma TaxID=117547 RepID=A0AAN9UZE4_9PEZI
MDALRSSSSQDGFFQETPILEPLYTSPRQLPPSQQQRAGSTDPRKASDDVTLARVLHLYLPVDKKGQEKPAQTIHNLARRSLNPDVLAHAVDAEVNHPVLKPFTTFGQENKNDPLWTTAGWRELKRIGHQEGVVAVGYEGEGGDYHAVSWVNRRVHQFGLIHVWTCTATMTTCPMAMTDGAAKLLRSHLDDRDGDQPGLRGVLREVYRRLVSRDPSEAWTSGQWMTERTGGSDVSGTETVARRLTEKELEEDRGQGHDRDAHGMPLGPWRIDGFKWFSSATDSDATLMLAQTGQGLGLFLAPMRRLAPSTPQRQQHTGHKPATELNGIRIQKLKDKLGTKSLPTAELELHGVRAWLIGRPSQGVREIATILTLTRLHTAAAAVGYWSRGLQASRAYARVRRVRGGLLLRDSAQHVRWMADNAVRYAAATHFSFLGHALLGAAEQEEWYGCGCGAAVQPARSQGEASASLLLVPRDAAERSALFRLLTPAIKAQVSVAAVLGLREHVEGLGGVGYCENNEDGGLLNLAKVFRDALVGPIWEGTVSVMAEDVVRVMTDRRIGGGQVVLNVFAPWVRRILADSRISGSDGGFPRESATIEHRLDILVEIEKVCDKEELLFRGRQLLEHLEAVTCSVLLLYDASTDGDEVATEIARRWVRSKALPGSRLAVALSSANWREEFAMDRKIFLGKEDSATPTRTLEKL